MSLLIHGHINLFCAWAGCRIYNLWKACLWRVMYHEGVNIFTLNKSNWQFGKVHINLCQAWEEKYVKHWNEKGLVYLESYVHNRIIAQMGWPLCEFYVCLVHYIVMMCERDLIENIRIIKDLECARTRKKIVTD